MNKHLLLTAILLLLCLQGRGQELVSGDTVVGRNFRHHTEIKATRYFFPEKILTWFRDGNTDYVLLQTHITDQKGKKLKNKTQLTMIDLASKSIKWTRETDRETAEIQWQEPYLFLTEKNTTHSLDPKTGNSLWNTKTAFYFTDPHTDVGIGYAPQSTSDKLSAIHLRTGQKLWERKIPRTFGWNDVFVYDDSTLLISANGLHAVHPKTGGGWEYKMNTTKKDLGKFIAVNALGILSAAFTGSYIYQTSPDVASDMGSNLLIDPEGNIIAAARDNVSSLNSEGGLRWKTPLPTKSTSSSSLILKDTVAYLINKGYAAYNGEFSTVGDPYIAAFDNHTGAQRYLQPIAEKKDFIRNYQVIDTLLFIVLADKVATHSLENGQRINQLLLPLQKNEEPLRFVEQGFYVKQNDSAYVDVMASDNNFSYLETSQKRLLSMDDELRLSVAYEPEQIFRERFSFRGYRFISNNDTDYIILSPDSTPVAEIGTTSQLFVARNKLYMMDNESIWEVAPDWSK